MGEILFGESVESVTSYGLRAERNAFELHYVCAGRAIDAAGNSYVIGAFKGATDLRAGPIEPTWYPRFLISYAPDGSVRFARTDLRWWPETVAATTDGRLILRAPGGGGAQVTTLDTASGATSVSS